jgi:GTPase SAR1 family protein
VKVLVVGPGGVGESALINALRQNNFCTNDPRDCDGYKHCWPSPSVLSKFDMVFYLYRNPFHLICSHYRRGWPLVQIRKLRGTAKHDTAEGYFAHVEDRDLFGFERHFAAWLVVDGVNFVDTSAGIVHPLSTMIPITNLFCFPSRPEYAALQKKHTRAARFYNNLYSEITDRVRKRRPTTTLEPPCADAHEYIHDGVQKGSVS